jgi:hypothetical protein
VSIKLDSFDYDLVENYYLENILANRFWLFCSHGSDATKPVSINSLFDEKSIQEKLVFGIEYDTQDVSFMIPVVSWSQGFIYTQYDDRADLRDKPFYVVVEPEIESGNYHVFKCLSNSNGSPSTQKPEFNPSIQDGIYFLSDGYIWKYMTSAPFSFFRKFAARNLMPIARNQQVENIADRGIYNIVVENRNQNSGYERITGAIRSINIQDGIATIFLRSLISETTDGVPIFDVPNVYRNRALFVEKTNNNIATFETEIRSSGVLGGIPFVTVTDPSNFTFDVDDNIEILPRVEITGNGTGCSAITQFDETNQRISSIRMISRGDDYTNAIATIIDPVAFDPDNRNRQDVRCVVRPIISPLNGHGSNVLRELNSRFIGFSKNVKADLSNSVPSSGTYSKFSIVKNPNFVAGFTQKSFDNRVKIRLASLPSNISVGDIVSQGQITAIVHGIDVAEKDLYVIDYEGPYSSIFDQNEPLRFQNSNFVINSITYSPYVRRSGKVLIISDVTPIERDETRFEQIKIILDF